MTLLKFSSNPISRSTYRNHRKSENSDLVELGGHLVRVLLDLRLVGVPSLAVPDLHVVRDAGEYHPLLQSGELFLMFRNEYPADAVYIHFRGTRKHEPVETARVGIHHRERLQFLREHFPLRSRVRIQTMVEAARHHDLAPHRGTEDFR